MMYDAYFMSLTLFNLLLDIFHLYYLFLGHFNKRQCVETDGLFLILPRMIC